MFTRCRSKQTVRWEMPRDFGMYRRGLDSIARCLAVSMCNITIPGYFLFILRDIVVISV